MSLFACEHITHPILHIFLQTRSPKSTS